jgi:hypothetical protein
LDDVLVIDPNTVTVLPAVVVVGVTPSDVWTEGPAVCAKAATDNRLKAASAANHFNENLAIPKYLLSHMSSHQSPRGTTG